MAIIEPHSRGTPLAQGDILKGIPLFSTRKSADADGYSASDTKLNLCLVLSRQCVVEHKRSLVVAGVGKYSEDIPPTLTFSELIDFLKTVRDGVDSPDLFYLGHLPELPGRYCARLDSLHTLELPPKPEDRQAFIDTHRIATLSKDFARNLHIRIHQAFADMGFEDYRWLSDGDLKLIVAQGREETSRIETDQQLAGLSRDLAGKSTDQKQIVKDQNSLEDIKKRVAPYVKELARRNPESTAAQAGDERAE